MTAATNRVFPALHACPSAQRAAFLLRWLACKDLAESLRHDSEEVLGICEANDARLALEEVEYLLKQNQPRLSG